MAVRIAMGRGSAVTLATTVTKIFPLNPQQTEAGKPTTFVLLETDVDVFLVSAKETVDGGALPTSGYIPLDATDRLVEYDISGYEFLGLAGSGVGTCRIELR